MSLTNSQAALIAAAGQFKGDDYETISAVKSNTLQLAREYQTWLDQQDMLAERLEDDSQ